MTNPNNVTDIVTPIPAKNITALTFFKPTGFVISDNVWFGASDGSIYVAQVSKFNNQFAFSCRMQTARINYGVHKMIPISSPVCTLVHWLGGNKQPGPVQIIYPGGVRVNVVDEATNVLYTKNRVLIFNGSKLQIFHFQANTILFMDENELQDVPTAMDVCGDYLIYYGNGTYYQMNLADSSASKIFSSVVRNPFVYTVGPSKVYLGDNDFIRVTELDGKEPGKLQYDRNNRVPNFMLPTQNCVYQFFPKVFTRSTYQQLASNESQLFNIDDVTSATMVNDCLLVATPQAIKFIGTMDDPATLASKVTSGKSSEVDDLLASLPKEQASSAAMGIFNTLWRNNKQKEAVELLSRNLIISDINKIVGLVPILIPTGEVPSFGDLKPIASDDQSLLEPMLAFLSLEHDGLRTIVKCATEYYNANTALAQCYAAFSKTRELDELIKEKKLDLKVFQQFLTTRAKQLNLNSAVAVLKTNVGQVEEALQIWHQLDSALSSTNQVNPLIIKEASYTVQQLKNSSNLAKELDWIYERDPNKPELALNAILSINHDSQVVDDWIKSKGLDALKLRYSVFIVTNTSTIRGVALANETFISLLDILKEIDSSSFDVNKLQFTQEYIKNSKDPQIKSKAKEEIIQYELQILKQHAPAIAQEDVKNHLPEDCDKRIIFALYRVKEEYEKGINLLTADDQFPKEEIEEFCRLAPNPPAAFSVWLKTVSPTDLITKHAAFVKENIAYMNLAELISLLPKDVRVKEVRDLVKSCYNLLQTRLYNLDNQIAISKSIQVDLNYQKVRALSGYTVLDVDAKCAACGQPIADGQAFAVPPGCGNKLMYHTNCKPTLI